MPSATLSSQEEKGERGATLIESLSGILRTPKFSVRSGGPYSQNCVARLLHCMKKPETDMNAVQRYNHSNTRSDFGKNEKPYENVIFLI